MAEACTATEEGAAVAGTAPNVADGGCAAGAGAGAAPGAAPAFAHGGQGGQVGAGGHCCGAGSAPAAAKAAAAARAAARQATRACACGITMMLTCLGCAVSVCHRLRGCEHWTLCSSSGTAVPSP